MSDGQEQSCPEVLLGMARLLVSHKEGRAEWGGSVASGAAKGGWGDNGLNLCERAEEGTAVLTKTAVCEAICVPPSPITGGWSLGRQGQGQHCLVCCPRKPQVGWVHLIYLRHASFVEYWRFRPHQHAERFLCRRLGGGAIVCRRPT